MLMFVMYHIMLLESHEREKRTYRVIRIIADWMERTVGETIATLVCHLRGQVPTYLRE